MYQVEPSLVPDAPFAMASMSITNLESFNDVHALADEKPSSSVDEVRNLNSRSDANADRARTGDARCNPDRTVRYWSTGCEAVRRHEIDTST